MNNPGLMVRLGASGDLMVELPGAEGTPRLLPLYGSVDLLVSILEGMAAGHEGLGEAGAPTGQLALHEAKHGVFPNERCPFCIIEGLSRGSRELATRKPRGLRAVGDGSVQVRHIPLGVRTGDSAPPAPKRSGPPAGLSKRQLQAWEQGEARRAAKVEEMARRLRGETRELLAKDLGL